jgi:antitoxin MazE
LTIVVTLYILIYEDKIKKLGDIMVKKLSKHGNSLAILIDKPILDLLNINEHTQINIRTDGTNIIIEPIRVQSASSIISENSKVQELYEELVDKYNTVLKKLSKN